MYTNKEVFVKSISSKEITPFPTIHVDCTSGTASSMHSCYPPYLLSLLFQGWVPSSTLYLRSPFCIYKKVHGLKGSLSLFFDNLSSIIFSFRENVVTETGQVERENIKIKK